MANSRNLLVRIAAAAVLGGVALAAGGSALAADGAAAKPRQAHVTGDAWVKFSLDPQNPLRRFVFDAHGAPFKVVDGKLVIGGAAHGTVKYFHPDGKGGGLWGTVKVDYVMTGGPVAVVSGTVAKGPEDKGTRKSFSVYSDPRGHKYDRMGFSWGALDDRCTQQDSAPAPFNSYASGKGYTVKHAELPKIPLDTDTSGIPAPTCTNT